MSRLSFGARRRWHHVALASAVLLLAGCASLSEDGGLAPVQQAAREQLGKDLLPARSDADLVTIEQRVAELLAKPLTADSAVQIALLNNRGLQASLQELGIAEAELVQASRLPNPGFNFTRLKRGSEREIERSFSFDLAHLIALPLSMPMEQRRFGAVQRSVSMQMLSAAFEARKAYYGAVAAEQTLRYMRDVKAAADAGAELARRMAEAGNWNKLQQAREHAFFADAALNLARAQRAQVAARERLIRQLGLWGTQTQFALPARLPELPPEPADRPDIEQAAMAQRLDVQAAKLQSEAMAKNLGLSKVTRFLNVLELGYQHNTSNELPRQTGYEITLEIPLFDWSGARVARAEALYMQSVHRTAQVAVDARSQVREAYLGYRSAWDIARHYRDDIVPAARRISDENLLRYNGMLIGVFELLADTRAQIAAVNGAIEAQRDYWIAQADLEMALIGPPSLPAVRDSSMAAAGASAH
ncbi:TolC family protein [Rivibacter subsaxonicus]|uniref:Outer membrane protein TolC n=1 Tax=Rivibacter subsaxonicus TaxID=457575 RepID=A0A4V2FUR9_9BURK|nr:TolC family protein [Rivibacter subsaxonicus]RZU03066.1 outer membrane protein TolC [Rivibacter subsaxonicus]